MIDNREDLKRAAATIERFADKYLDGNIDGLATFTIGGLWGDKEFGSPGRQFDPDDTELMRAIYVLIFSDVWPGLTLESLANGEYRGETMNTYNTLFGAPDWPYHPDTAMHGLDKQGYVYPAFRSKVAHFRFKIYQRIGNYVVLPNLALDCEDDKNTINRYRGCHDEWHDFFDRFLVGFRKALLDGEYFDDRFQKIMALNEPYLKPFMTPDSFLHLCKELFFDDYLDEAGMPTILTKGFFWWNKGTIAKEDYFAEANRFIDFSTKVINHRTELMLNKIKHQLEIMK